MDAWMPKYNAFSGYVNASTVFYYRPQTKLREGNVFTCVCDSVHGGRCLVPGGLLLEGGACSWVGVCSGGGAWSQEEGVPGPRGGVPAPGGEVPGGDPPDGFCCGRYASYWNAFLLL